MYGSSWIGIWRPERDVEAEDWWLFDTEPMSGTSNGIRTDSFLRVRTNYELSNHLGNVLVTISDRKLGIDADTDDDIDYYEADILTANDYYPFGMALVGRQFSSSAYRYGFQSQEKENEIYGEGNAISFKYRVHDARLGRFLSIDPLAAKYPHNSPYAFSENRVIDAVELEGLEKVELKDLGSNATQEVTGLYTVKIGMGENQQTYSGVSAIDRDGQIFLDLTPQLKGQALYSSSPSGPTMSNLGAEYKISIDDNIFSPQYNTSWDDSQNGYYVNCAGVVFRNILAKYKLNNFVSLETTESLLSDPSFATPVTANTKLKEGDNLVTLQKFSWETGYYDNNGAYKPVLPISRGADFHIVAAPLGPQGRELPNYVWTNGHRPVISYTSKQKALVKEYDEYTSNDIYASPVNHTTNGPEKGKRVVNRLTITTSQFILK